MYLPVKRLLLPLFAAFLTGCAAVNRTSGEDSAPPGIEVVQLGTMRDISLCSGVWFGAEPTPEDLDLARRRGVRRVLVIDEAGPSQLESLCAELDLELERFRVSGPPEDRGEMLAVMRALGEEDAGGDTLLFSEDGSMAAALFAAYRITYEGVPVDRALLEARRSGMRAGETEDLVRELSAAPGPLPSASPPR